MLTGDEIHRHLYLLNKSKSAKPFKKAEEIDGKKPKNVNLYQYMNSASNKDEMEHLKITLKNNPDLTVRKILNRSKFKTEVGKGKEAKGLFFLTKKNLDGKKNKTTKAKDLKDKMGDYERYLFYEGLADLGISDVVSLENFLAVDDMERKGKEFVGGKRISSKIQKSNIEVSGKEVISKREAFQLANKYFPKEDPVKVVAIMKGESGFRK